MGILPPKEERINFKIDKETNNKIMELVIKNKSSVSAEIRKMIDFYFESKERLEQ